MHLLENERYRELLKFVYRGVDLDFLQDKTILITGASGMLGSCLVDALALWNQEQNEPCRIVAVSRNENYAKDRFAPWLSDPKFSLVSLDVCQPLQGLPDSVDYIIHAASNADPRHFAQTPVDTLLANVMGTRNLLEYGMTYGMERFLFVSSGEVYGQPDDAMSDFTEGYCGPLDLSSPRSCYPEGKRAAEVLCQSYIAQYGVDAVIVRPCHLFGPTMTRQDNRAVSEFLRKAAAGEDIILKSAGTLERSHCFVFHAVSALLVVLREGLCGEVYNIADKQLQMTVREFAEMAAQGGQCCVIQEKADEDEAKGYSKSRRAVLCGEKLDRLGWQAKYGDQTGVRETIEILRTLAKAGGCL